MRNRDRKIKYYFDTSGLSEELISKQLKELLLPDYKTISQLYPYEISGGMAQRLSFLFAILPKPKLLAIKFDGNDSTAVLLSRTSAL